MVRSHFHFCQQNSAGKTYEESVQGRWKLATPIPEKVKGIIVQDASQVEQVVAEVDFVFCAVDMKKNEIQALEEAYAKTGTPVISNNSAHRWTPDVPMVIPEINPGHIDVIAAQTSGNDNRFHCREAKLLHSELCTGASRFA